MTLQQCLDSQASLKLLADKNIPFKTAYKISRLIEIVEKNIGYYNNQYNELIKKYAILNEDGSYQYTDDSKTSVRIDTTKANEIQEKINELNNIEIIDEIPLIKESDLTNIEIAPKDVYFLLPFIKTE